jgi:hypothetical protein
MARRRLLSDRRWLNPALDLLDEAGPDVVIPEGQQPLDRKLDLPHTGVAPYATLDERRMGLCAVDFLSYEVSAVDRPEGSLEAVDPPIGDKPGHPLRTPMIYDPLGGYAPQAAMKIAQTYHRKLNRPLKAAEIYQEQFFARGGGDQGLQDAIFQIGSELKDQKRWVEAMHVLEVFVDSFPRHPQRARRWRWSVRSTRRTKRGRTRSRRTSG